MKRLFAVALVLVAVSATPASGAPRGSTLRVVAGSAQAGSQVSGWFAVRNVGGGPSPRTVAKLVMRSGTESRPLARWTIPRLTRGERRRIGFSVAVPNGTTGTWSIEVCLRGRCHRLSRITIAPGQAPLGAAPSVPPTPPALPTTTPEEPLAYKPGEPFHHTAGGVEYWGFVPYSYDPATPTPLLIWLHGCGGYSEGDAWVVDPGELEGEEQDWLTLALGGREGGCWDPPEDEPKVLEALANFESHFDVDHRRVILGGYSSGGDLAYRTGFFHSSTFAGLLIVNSAPFRDTGASQAELLGAASTKLHIVHLAHEQDDTYELAEVQAEVEAVEDAGFPIELIEVPGEHWNEPGDLVEGAPVPGTDADILTYLLPHMADGWESP